MPDGRAPVSLGGILRRARHALTAVSARLRSLMSAPSPAPGHAAAAPTTDPRLAQTDSAIAAYVSARAPEWFSIDVETPEQDIHPAPSPTSTTARDAQAPGGAFMTAAISRSPDLHSPDLAVPTTNPAPPQFPDTPHAGQSTTPAQSTAAAEAANRTGDVAIGDATGRPDPAGGTRPTVTAKGPRFHQAVAPGPLQPTGETSPGHDTAAHLRFRPAVAPRTVEPGGEASPGHDTAARLRFRPAAAPPPIESSGEASPGHDPHKTFEAPTSAFVPEPVRPTNEHASDPPAPGTGTDWSSAPARRRNPLSSPMTRQEPPPRSPIASRFPRAASVPDRGHRTASPPETRQAPSPQIAIIDGPWPTGRVVPAEKPRSPWPKLPESAWRPDGAADRESGSGQLWAARPDDALILEQRST